ncbi:MAG: VanZ family protein [Gemmatimonadales bacterium]
MTPQKRYGLALAVFGWALIAALTLYPNPSAVPLVAATPVWCIVCGRLGLVDVLLNVILFLPLGAGLGVLGLRFRHAVLLLFGTTLAVEVLQLWIPGRDSSLSDLLSNTLGGSLGFLLATTWRRLLLPAPAPARRLALGWMGGWLGLQLFSSWALQPSMPRSTYFGQWAPELGQFDQYTGRVDSVTLGGLPLGGTALPETDSVRALLLRGGALLRVRALSGTPTERLAPIFSIFDDAQRNILLLGEIGRDVVYAERDRLARLRLRSPVFLLPYALPAGPGLPVTLEATRRDGRIEIRTAYTTADSVTHTAQVTMQLSPSWSWAFVLPWGHTLGMETGVVTMLWLAVLFLPAGYWTHRARLLLRSPGGGSKRLGPGATLLGLVLVAGLAAMPVAFGFGLSGVSEWIGAAGGVVLGAKLRTED